MNAVNEKVKCLNCGYPIFMVEAGEWRHDGYALRCCSTDGMKARPYRLGCMCLLVWSEHSE